MTAPYRRRSNTENIDIKNDYIFRACHNKNESRRLQVIYEQSRLLKKSKLV